MRKRQIPILIAISMLLLLSFTLTACKSAQPVDYAGVYTMSYLQKGDEVMDGEELAVLNPPEENYIEIIDSTNIVFVLYGDKVTTTYSMRDNILQVRDDTSTISLTLLGNDLSIYLDPEDITLVFTKE
ncbi:MAG: hypothetical protein FWH50_00610 [Coriobacteriia bacterium]|nr:hypothetical protein [Coriobacteriia bacterium]